MSIPAVNQVADAHIARTEGGQRSLTEVAVGVLIRPDGSFLMTSRPAGKAYGGYWEFPGGKVESGESTEQALYRELYEELGICAGQWEAWRSEVVDYPHALVRLNFFKVSAWTGQLQMREGQQAQWQRLPAQVEPVLPGALPVLDWLQAESGGATEPVA